MAIYSLTIRPRRKILESVSFFGPFFGSGAGRRAVLFLGGRWERVFWCVYSSFLSFFGAFFGPGAGRRAALFWGGR